MKPLLKPKAVAEILQCGEQKAKELMESGRIASIDIGSATKKHLRTTEEAVLAFVNPKQEKKDKEEESKIKRRRRKHEVRDIMGDIMRDS